MKNVIEILDRYYQSFINQKRGWDFFLGLADYVKYAVETQEVDNILKRIVQARDNDQRKLKKYEQEVIKETKQAKEKLFKIIKEHKISDEALDRAIEEYQGYEKGTILSSQSKGEALSEALIDIIRILFKRGYKELVRDFAIEHKEIPNEIGKYTFSKTLNSYYEEQEIFNDKLKTELWASWDSLALAYLAVFKVREKLKELRKDEKNFYTAWNFVGLAGEMKKIRDGDINRLTGMPSDFEPIHFKKENYISHASRVHNYLIKELNSEKQAKVTGIDKQTSEIEKLLDKLKSDINKKVKGQEQFEVKVKDRQIWINDYFLSKPYAVGSNFEFFEYIRSKSPNTLIARDKMPNVGDGIGYGYTKEAIKKKGFIKILNGLGFKGEILKAFFYKRSKDTLIYRGDKITKKDLEKAGIKMTLFLKELELAHLKNSPE